MSPRHFDREPEMYRLRVVEGLTLRQIGERYGISVERVRQLLRPYIWSVTAEAGSMTEVAARRRHERKLADEQANTEAILQAWRTGENPREIAKQLGIRRSSVAEIITATARNTDRAARRRAQRDRRVARQADTADTRLVALGETIRHYRKHRRMSRRELAQAAGIPERQLTALEQGHLDPTFDLMLDLSQALDTELSQLFLVAECNGARDRDPGRS